MKEYNLKSDTLLDIIEQVPSDKWTTVLEEMKGLIIDLGAAQKTAELFTNVLDCDVDEIIEMPKTVKWIDDGESSITVNIVEKNGGGNDD